MIVDTYLRQTITSEQTEKKGSIGVSFSHVFSTVCARVLWSQPVQFPPGLRSHPMIYLILSYRTILLYRAHYTVGAVWLGYMGIFNWIIL